MEGGDILPGRGGREVGSSAGPDLGRERQDAGSSHERTAGLNQCDLSRQCALSLWYAVYSGRCTAMRFKEEFLKSLHAGKKAPRLSGRGGAPGTSGEDDRVLRQTTEGTPGAVLLAGIRAGTQPGRIRVELRQPRRRQQEAAATQQVAPAEGRRRSRHHHASPRGGALVLRRAKCIPFYAKDCCLLRPIEGWSILISF